MPTFDKSNTTEGVVQQFLVEDNRRPLHQNVIIDTLPDDVLLAIFTSYLCRSGQTDVWRTLVHVCQRWRYLVFASPGDLDLHLECTIETRTREMLSVWPTIPIDITDSSSTMSGVDNIIAALEQRDRVCSITLDDVPGWKMDTLVGAMLGPFPALTSMLFWADELDSAMAVVPDSFLGGSAPQLQSLYLRTIPFPALPTLLSSTRNLVDLQVSGIPRTGYISPEVMVTCLSAMPRLETLRFQFDSPESFPDGESRGHPPLARSTLPALRELTFEGVDEYFEDLFIGRVEVFKSPAHADINLLYGLAKVSVGLQTETDDPAWLQLGISCDELHLQLRHFVQVFSSPLLPFSDAGSLAISSVYQLWQSQRGPTAEDLIWLDLLHTFSAVKVLDIDQNSLTPIAYALKDVVKDRITEMFPVIRELSIGEHLPSGPTLRAIEKFANARGLFSRLDHPHRWVAG